MTRSFYAFTAGPTVESSQFKTSDEALTGFGGLINLFPVTKIRDALGGSYAAVRRVALERSDRLLSEGLDPNALIIVVDHNLFHALRAQARDDVLCDFASLTGG